MAELWPKYQIVQGRFGPLVASIYANFPPQRSRSEAAAGNGEGDLRCFSFSDAWAAGSDYVGSTANLHLHRQVSARPQARGGLARVQEQAAQGPAAGALTAQGLVDWVLGLVCQPDLVVAILVRNHPRPISLHLRRQGEEVTLKKALLGPEQAVAELALRERPE